MLRRLGLGILVGALLGVCVFVSGPLGAAGTKESEAILTELEVSQPTAPVILDGEVLFRVRGISAFPAEERARLVEKRIRGIAGDPAILASSLRVVEEADRSVVLAGDHLLMNIVDADAAVEGIPRALLAEMVRRKIEGAIGQYRLERTPKILLKKTGFALGSTVVLILLIYLQRRFFGWFRVVAKERLKSRLKGLESKSFQLLRADRLEGLIQTLTGVIQITVILAILVLYFDFVLASFPWTKLIGHRLFAILFDPIRVLGNAVVATLPNLAFIAVLIVIIRYVLKLMRLFFGGVDQGSIQVANFDREWAWPTYRIVRILVIAFSLVVAYPYIPGSGSPAFKGVSIFLGVIFSLGSSSFLSNVLAGYTLTYRRAFKVGDRIRIDEVTGDVVEMRLLVTHLRTVKNEEIIVPNSTILTSNVMNYSTYAKSGGLILHTTVGIGYEAPWRQVEAMLLLAAERTPGLLRDPKPFVWQKALGDFAVTYEINVYSDNPQKMASLYTALHQNILDAFNEQGVQIMTPAYEGDPESPKVVPKDKWFSPPAKSKG